ncbi:hypothetical protein [Bacillus infantis]|uniref:Uncharacterized protein n=1 Tax=Bacillus infantis TaxID=324767 RepID=A0A5D4R530_9BACI|nr:hypothetical protein [Bacillus infantis]TYS45670.1 hypothetical protein FZD51_19055 [Bacillus infantis]
MAMAEGNFLWITGLKWVADIQTIKGFHGTYILLLFNDIIYLRFMTKTKHMECEMKSKSKIITSFSLAYSVQLASAFSLTTSQLMIFVSAAAFLLFGIGLLIKKFLNKNN